MKRYSLGLFSILLAISLAAFTNDKLPNNKHDSYYWFNVPSSINNDQKLTNGQVSYLNAFQATDPNPAPCTGSTKYCHVGFTSGQVTVIGSSVTVNGSQTPAIFDSKP